MKILFAFICFAVAASAQVASMMAGANAAPLRDLTVITFRADGSVVVTNDTLKSRSSIEQMVRMWDQYSNYETEDDEAPRRRAVNTNAFSDDELARKIRQAAINAGTAYGLENEVKFERIDITTNTVRTLGTITYTGLREFVGHALMTFSQAGFPSSDIEVRSTNGQLRITFVPNQQMKRYSRMMADHWKASGGSNEVRLVFPGNIVASDLSGFAGNSTWLKFGAYSNASIDAMLKIMEKPAVVTAEPGGLMVEQALSARSLQRASRRGTDGDDGVPITDAGPGFQAEAVSVTTSTSYLFPEGEKLAAGQHRYMGRGTGTVVHAKLFAPKGRSILSVSDVRVLKATDDKGRNITAAKTDDANDEDRAGGYTSFSGSGRANSSTTIQLQLPLPARDAQSIADVAAQAVATTVSKWNEITVTNTNPKATNEFDLNAILPGAKLVVRKIASRNRQTTIDADLKGPKEVHRIDIQHKTPGAESEREFGGSQSSMNARRVTNTGGVTTRTVQISHYVFDEDGAVKKDGPVVLLVRYPTDLKRERVQIKLESLDLF